MTASQPNVLTTETWRVNIIGQSSTTGYWQIQLIGDNGIYLGLSKFGYTHQVLSKVFGPHRGNGRNHHRHGGIHPFLQKGTDLKNYTTILDGIFVSVDSFVPTNRTIWDIVPVKIGNHNETLSFHLVSQSNLPLASCTNCTLASMAPNMVLVKSGYRNNIQVLEFTASSVQYTQPTSFPPQLATYNIRAPFGDGQVVMITHDALHAFARCAECTPTKTGNTTVSLKTINYDFTEFWIVEYVGDASQGNSLVLCCHFFRFCSFPITSRQRLHGLFCSFIFDSSSLCSEL